MNRFFIASAAALILLTSCNTNNSEHNSNTSELKGGIYMGGILRVNEV